MGVPPMLASAVHALSRREGCTLYMVLLAAFQALLHRYSSQEDFCVGTPIANRTSKFDLTLTMMEGVEGLSGTIEYSTDLFEEATIRRLLGHYQTLLEAVVADPDLKLSRLPLLSPVERRQLSAWGRNDADYPA